MANTKDREKKIVLVIIIVILIIFAFKTKIFFIGAMLPQDTFACETNITDITQCEQVYNPVCGSDGITYGNECKGCNSGISYYAVGVCKIAKLQCSASSDCLQTECVIGTNAVCDTLDKVCKCISPPKATPPSGLANPASVLCQKIGTSEIRTDASGGQYGVCKFNDGSECDEWKLYRGECQPTSIPLIYKIDPSTGYIVLRSETELKVIIPSTPQNITLNNTIVSNEVIINSSQDVTVPSSTNDLIASGVMTYEQYQEQLKANKMGITIPTTPTPSNTLLILAIIVVVALLYYMGIERGEKGFFKKF